MYCSLIPFIKVFPVDPPSSARNTTLCQTEYILEQQNLTCITGVFKSIRFQTYSKWNLFSWKETILITFPKTLHLVPALQFNPNSGTLSHWIENHQNSLHTVFSPMSVAVTNPNPFPHWVTGTRVPPVFIAPGIIKQSPPPVALLRAPSAPYPQHFES